MPTRMPSLKPRELPSAGPHAAVCYLFANLGTQHTKFGLKEQLCFGFELLDQRQANGTAFTIITLPYTISSEPKASLRQDMESWFGRAFTSDDFGALDLEERVGTTALLGVKHVLSNGKEYANIASIMPPPPGAPARKLPINGVVIFNFAEREDRLDAAIRGPDKPECSPGTEHTGATAAAPGNTGPSLSGNPRGASRGGAAFA